MMEQTQLIRLMEDYNISDCSELEKALAFWNDQDTDYMKRCWNKGQPMKVAFIKGKSFAVCCPNCGRPIAVIKEHSYCPHCGQRLD